MRRAHSTERRSLRRIATYAWSSAVLPAVWLAMLPARASDSSDELVRQAQAHERLHEDDLAARRYTEALDIDPLSAAAWLGLAELRARCGDNREAEKVFTAALQRLPLLTDALAGRAQVRWRLGLHREAEADLQAFADTTGQLSAYRKLADWFGFDGRGPAQLAAWRRLLQADDLSDTAHIEAQRMVRALIAVVAEADPVCSPADRALTRLALASLCTRPSAGNHPTFSPAPSKRP